MLTSTTNSNSSQVTTYTRGGQPMSLFRSEPVRRVTSVPQSGTGGEQESGDRVSLSQAGLEKSRQQNGLPTPGQDEAASGTARETKPESQQSAGLQELTQEEEKAVLELKQRDREVKAHEMAHLATAGQYARGGASYTYQQGPDGRRYAIGGEVPIDLSEEKTPEETIQKMQTIKRAAMAPAEPSSTDRSVAANATAMESRARQEVQAEEADPSREQSATGAAADERETVAASTPPEGQRANSNVDVMA